MFKQLNKSLFNVFGGRNIKLTKTSLFLIVVFVLMSVSCLSMYGLTKVQEGLVMKKQDNERMPYGVLEPGTGRPVEQSFLSGDNTTMNNPYVNGSQIPQGDEDLYILKSQIVPPVCPKCPVVINKCNENEKKCPPCPPCGRCPEPAFECKKVPNYSSSNIPKFPLPLLNDFSQF
jgi:hypothetical protein